MLDAEREIFSAGATLRYPEFEALDAGAGRWFLARGFGDGAVKFLRDSEDAGEALVAEMCGERGVGGEAHEGVARCVDFFREVERDGLRGAGKERDAERGERDVRRVVVQF